MAQDLENIDQILAQGLDFVTEEGRNNINKLFGKMNKVLSSQQSKILSLTEDNKQLLQDKDDAETALELYTVQFLEACELSQKYMK